MNRGQPYDGRPGGPGSYGGPDRGRFQGRDDRRPQPPSGPDQDFAGLLEAKVDVRAPAIELFDSTAQEIAKRLADAGRDVNKSSQLRRFYDEIIRHVDAHRETSNAEGDKARFQRDLPFIRLICAHAAYAKTRKHVDANFVAFLQHGLRQVDTPEHLRMLRTLFEAVIGFMPKKS